MRICLFHRPEGCRRVGLVEGDRVYDLTAADPQRAGSLTAALDAGAEGLATAAGRARRRPGWPLADPAGPQGPPPLRLLAPIERQEVWAAGVTYLRSRDARMQETAGGESFYDRVYAAERPELFFKSSPHRTAGPGESVRIRRDAHWNVPEPELALVLTSDLRIAGYTIGNDMSARDIEGENPLYLPQAKVYVGGCAVGPVVLLAEPGCEQPRFSISLTITREGEAVFRAETSTAQMKRSFADLVAYLGRANTFPDGAILLTGTGIVPPDEFTLQEGDEVEIAVPEIGTLRNPVSLSL